MGVDWVLVSEDVTIELEMGRAETGLGFSRFGALGSRWRRSGH